MSVLDKLQQLYDRLDDGLHKHFFEWNKLPSDVLVALSREITAVRDAYGYLTEAHDFETHEIDHLLNLPDPLQTVADKWMERMSDLSDFDFALDEVFKDVEDQRRDTSVEKSSVLEKLKDKATLPPKPHIPGKEQDVR